MAANQPAHQPVVSAHGEYILTLSVTPTSISGSKLPSHLIIILPLIPHIVHRTNWPVYILHFHPCSTRQWKSGNLL